MAELMRMTFAGTTAAVLLLTMAEAAQDRGGRFSGMDRNNDGVITRQEWRGSDQSFRVHDWNGDGVLSGDEVAGRGRRLPPADEDWGWGDADRGFGGWSEREFADLDHDRDSRLSEREWHDDIETFWRIDRNRDGYVTRAEFLDARGGDDRGDRFEYLDRDGNGRLSPSEWHGDRDTFEWLDRNDDGSLSRAEVMGPGSRRGDRFERLDVDGSATITRDEWHGTAERFDRLDIDRNGAISRDEWGDRTQQAGAPVRTAAYEAGYRRGMDEGRQAGLEDASRATWDLEGQRELEQADSGYTTGLGPRAEYQRGYRAGFRVGYAEGFGPRRRD